MITGKSADGLFAGTAAPAPVRVDGRGGARPGAGRPPAARNRVNRDLRSYLVGVTGKEAILELYRLATVPILGPDPDDELQVLARRLCCPAAVCRSKEEGECGANRRGAAELVLRAAGLVFPHIYPRLGTLEIKPAGSPDGERETIELDDAYRMLREVDGVYREFAAPEQASGANDAGDGSEPAETLPNGSDDAGEREGA